MPQENENENEFVNENEMTHSAIVDELQTNAREIIRLGRRNVALHKLCERSYKRDVKDARKYKKNKNPDQKKEPSGFNKPSPVPVEFHEQPWGCSEGQELPRTVLTKMVYDYIKEKNLKDADDKRVIITSGDEGKVIRRLFHLKKDEKLEFRNFQTYMARLYKRGDDLPDYESESEEEEAPVKKQKAKGKKGKKGKQAPNSV